MSNELSDLCIIAKTIYIIISSQTSGCESGCVFSLRQNTETPIILTRSTKINSDSRLKKNVCLCPAPHPHTVTIRSTGTHVGKNLKRWYSILVSTGRFQALIMRSSVQFSSGSSTNWNLRDDQKV